MSKIEKALNRAREGRGGLQVVSTAGVAPATGTAVVPGDLSQHSENISRMAKGEAGLLGAAELARKGIIQQSEDAAVQVFRDLRTKIIQLTQGRNAIVLVTSVSPGCGSTFIAQNLGAAFAFDMGKTALVMDCNLHNPSVHRLLSKDSALGLVDYFENPNMDVKAIIHPVGIARYRVIPAGKRRATLEEHFTSAKMRRLMDAVRRRYPDRFVVVDGPPMSKIADVRTLSELVDYVLIVARYARSTNAQIAKCVEGIGEKKLLGIVFNEEPRFPRSR